MGFHCGQFWAALWWKFFINYLRCGIITTIIKSAYKTRLEGQVGKREGRRQQGAIEEYKIRIQNDLESLKKVPQTERFSRNKCNECYFFSQYYQSSGCEAHSSQLGATFTHLVNIQEVL